MFESFEAGKTEKAKCPKKREEEKKNSTLPKTMPQAAGKKSVPNKRTVSSNWNTRVYLWPHLPPPQAACVLNQCPLRIIFAKTLNLNGKIAANSTEFFKKCITQGFIRS